MTIKINSGDLDRVVSRAITGYMNALAPSLPPLWWTHHAEEEHRDWSLHGLAEDGDPEAVEAWAAELNLTRVSDPVSPGLVEYSGKCSARNIAEVVVWCVADRDAFEASVVESRAAVAEYRAARATAEPLEVTADGVELLTDQGRDIAAEADGPTAVSNTGE